MFFNKTITYEQMEKPKKDKKFKQNEYEEIRKLVEDGEDTNIIKDASEKSRNTRDFVSSRGFRDIKNKKKTNNKEISYNFKLFD